MARHEQIEQIICPVIEDLGYQFVGLEYLPQGKWSLLRVYIDKLQASISVDECAVASRKIEAVLAVESPIHGEYTLEVSSPGIEAKK